MESKVIRANFEKSILRKSMCPRAKTTISKRGIRDLPEALRVHVRENIWIYIKKKFPLPVWARREQAGVWFGACRSIKIIAVLSCNIPSVGMRPNFYLDNFMIARYTLDKSVFKEFCPFYSLENALENLNEWNVPENLNESMKSHWC